MASKYLDEVRKIPAFRRAVLKSAILYSEAGKLVVSLITEKSYTREDRDALEAVTQKFVPSSFTFELDVTKVVADPDVVRRRAFELAKGLSPMVESTLEPRDIEVKCSDDKVEVKINLTVFRPTDEAAALLENALSKCFCSEISVELAKKEVDESFLTVEKTEYNEDFHVEPRTFRVTNFKPIQSRDGGSAEATYIADAGYSADDVVLCGVVTSIEHVGYQRKEEEKEFLVFNITDTTGAARIACFPRKSDADEIGAIKEGDSIVCLCVAEVRGDYLSYKSKKIDYGSVPENFVPEKKQSRPVPKVYETVKPVPYADETQQNFFSVKIVPDFVKNNVFVVFDIETTGTNTVASGSMDKIIELGACKVIGGEIVETFSSLINPEIKLPRNIVELTHITDEMIVGAPTYDKVLPDFFKFCDGAYLVGHNIDGFDIKFLDYYWGTLGYIRSSETIDTLTLSISVLPGLSNRKLKTLADHYGYELDPHRACNDSVATAKVFMDLEEEKASRGL
ncbi:MAG: hypothetical protein LUD29_05475 [Clostridia bacterium]|nr:hypothetical protein [Clostridia bacterium]